MSIPTRYCVSRLPIILAAVIVGSSLSVVVDAQTAPASSADATATQNDSRLVDIIVTADKRDVKLQSAPLAISAISSATLDHSNINNFSDLTGFAPSLVVTKEEGFERAVTIRGLGKANTQAGIAQSVALHQDGVFFASTVSLSTDLIDVNRIEVLRGPQGTVYGQNAIGGVINIITNQPKLDKVEGEADIAGGSYNTFQARGVVNIPIGDRLAIRVSGQHFKHDGYTTNLFNGKKLDEENNLSGRVQVLWRPLYDLDITGRFQVFDTSVNGQALKNIFDPAPNPRQLSHNFPDLFAFNSKVASLNIEWRQPFFKAKFIGSYQKDRTRNQLDLDRGVNTFTDYLNHADTLGVSTGIITDDRILRNNTDRQVYTAELNVVSVKKGPIDWILGAFYSREKRLTDYLEIGDGNHDGIVSTEAQVRAVVTPANVFFINGDFANGFEVTGTAVDRALAFYGQATLHLSDRVRFTDGLRYSDQTARNNSITYFFFPSNNGAKSKLWTGKASVEYDLAAHALGYATYTRGAKPGGGSLTNGQTFVLGVYKPEKVNAFEIGVKSRFLENKLQVNVAGYYYDFSNFQVIGADPSPFGAGVINIPKSRNYGAEVEANALLTDRLRLDFSGSWQQSRITSHFLAIDGVRAVRQNGISYVNGIGLFDPANIAARAATAQDLYGNRLPRTPEFQSNATASYAFDVVEHHDLVLSANYNWIDGVTVRPFANPERDFIPSYGLFNISADFTHDRWSFQVAASNVFDRNAINNRFTDAFGVAATADTLVPPRVVKVRAGYRF